MILSAILPMLLMQVGPNPAQPTIPALPIDPANRTAEAAPNSAPSAIPERLRECLLVVRESPANGEADARKWIATAGGSDAALARQCLGMALYTQGRFAEASAAFLDARERTTETDSGTRGRLSALAGNAGLASGEFIQALAALDLARMDAVASGDDRLLGETQIDRARALVELDRAEEAADALTAARDAMPDSADAWLLSATLSRRLGRLANAQAQIETAATLAPQSPDIGLEAGVIAASAGRYDDAGRSFRSVIAVAPDSPQAARAQTYLDRLAVMPASPVQDPAAATAINPPARPDEGR